MKDLVVAFPKPCSEPWDGMRPSGCNRHCATCDKTIHDLAALRTEEIELLLEGDEEVCARGIVRADGSLVTSDRVHVGRRTKMVAATSLALSLSLAACQTTDSQITPLYSVSGTASWGIFDRKVTLVRSDGRTYRRTVSPGREFTIPNLHAGTYDLTVSADCAGTVTSQITVGSEDVDLGRVELESECIIVGVLVRPEYPTFS